jgi:hypothetical protein
METFIHILSWGGVFTFCSFIILIGSWIIDPKIWGADLNAEEKYGNRIGGLITVIILIEVQISIMPFATMKEQNVKTPPHDNI